MWCHTTPVLASLCCVFFFNDTATTEIYTLSLHDALPIWLIDDLQRFERLRRGVKLPDTAINQDQPGRSEEHTSELQSRLHLVCRLLLEKKNLNKQITHFVGLQFLHLH